MSQDLYQSEIAQSLSGLRPVESPEADALDNFVSGSGRLTMKGLAGIGSGVDILGGALAKIQDTVMQTGTEAQDRYFKEHDDVFGSAMDYWTPRPNEVGVAAEVVGGLVSTLPLLLVAPELVLAGAYGRTSEELVRKGVAAGKAQAVGALETGGLALGLWMPVLGRTGWERVLVGGAAYNAVQGVATRGAASEILKDTAAREDYKAFDPQALTLDVLLGLAFGTFAHLAPAQRAAGEKAWTQMMDWAKQLSPSDVDAIVALRQAEHLNVDSAPGKFASAQDVEAHAQRVRTALDQLAKGDQVAIDALPKANFTPDARRARAAEQEVARLTKVAEKVRTEEGIAPLPEAAVEKWYAALPEAERAMLAEIPGLQQKYAHALAVEPKFAEVVNGIARAENLKVIMGPLKGVERASEKVKADYAGDASRIKDLLRATIVADTPESAASVLTALTGRLPLLGDVRNALGRESPPAMPEGYRDIKVNVTVDGLPTEVQVNLPEMIHTKEELHPLYIEREKLTRKAMLERRDLTPEEAARRNELTETMRKTYDEVWAAILAKKPASGISEPLRSTDATGNQTGLPEDQSRAAAPEGSTETGAPSTSKNLVPLGKASTEGILPKTEAPAAKGGAAEPPPPRGSDAASKVAGAEVHPAMREAELLVQEAPDLTLRVGTNADGSPVVMKAADYLNTVKAAAAKLREDAKLIGVAAQCLLGVL